MKYKLLKELPLLRVWTILNWIPDNRITTYDSTDVNSSYANRCPDFFEPIVEKKTYDSIEKGDKIYFIDNYWCVDNEKFESRELQCRSEVFLTHQEAEDEHKRREWGVRKDKFYPKEAQRYFMPIEGWDIDTDVHSWYAHNIHIINLWLAFRTREDCQDAIDNHDLIRLFYNIR